MITDAHLFPPADSDASYTQTLGSFDFTPLARSLQIELDLEGSLARFPTGSLPVFAVGDQSVLKMFPPDDLAAAATEWEALNAFATSGFTPLPIRQHSANGWRFIVMSHLDGVGLDTIWPNLDTQRRQALAHQTGQRLRSLHDLTKVETGPHVDAWHAWKHEQLRSLVATQRRLGLEESWCAQLIPFISRNLGDDEPRGVALLHTEVMPAHLTVTRHHGEFSLSGLCDFEPAMFGDVDYEFASVGAFMSCGDAPVLGVLLKGWGIARSEHTAELSRRLLAMLLLHRYCHLPRYLARLPTPSEATLEAAADAWFGLP